MRSLFNAISLVPIPIFLSALGSESTHQPTFLAGNNLIHLRELCALHTGGFSFTESLVYLMKHVTEILHQSYLSFRDKKSRRHDFALAQLL